MIRFPKPAMLFFLILTSCAAPPEKKTERLSVQQEQPASKPAREEHALPETEQRQEQTIAAWAAKNLGVDLKDETFEKAGITDRSKFAADIDPKMKRDLFDPFFLGDREKGEVTVEPGVVKVDLSTGDMKYLFITEHYIIISAHLSMGNNGGSLLYNLDTRKLERLNMNVEGFLEPHLLDVWFDYYEDTHVWEYGTYDIRTKKYTKIRKEQ
jgi:hypothetical protein